MSSLETETKTHVRALEGVNAQRNALGVDVDDDLNSKAVYDTTELPIGEAQNKVNDAVDAIKKADEAKKKAENEKKEAEAAKKKAENEKKEAEAAKKKAADEQKIAEEIAKKKAIAEAKRKSLEQMDHMTLSVTTEYRGVCVGWVKTNDSDNAPMVMAACAKTKENTCPAVFNNRCTILRPMKTTVTEGAKIMMF